MTDSRSAFTLKVTRSMDDTRFTFSLADILRTEFTANFDESILMLGAIAPARASELFTEGKVQEKHLDRVNTFTDKNAVSFVRDLSSSSILCPSCGAAFRAIKGAALALKREQLSLSVEGVTIEFALPKWEMQSLTNLLADVMSANPKTVELHPQLARVEFTPQESENKQFALSGGLKAITAA